MELQVIGAGFGRTGTLSMKAALEQLGFGPCHHMLEVFAHPEHAPAWAAAVRGERWDAEAALAGYRSTLDFPSSLVWRELAAANPDALVLLTVRSSESWWRSFDATIGPTMRTFEPPEGFEAIRDVFDAIDEVVFSDRSDEREAAVGAFEAHNAAVIAEVPADRLLVYELGSGWEPLCERLGVAVPDEPFPSSNSTEEFQGRARSSE